MKSLSCISLSSPHEPAPPTLPHYIPTDTDKYTVTRTTDLGNKGPKLQTIIQVLRCELSRPGRQAQNSTLPPSKHWTPVHHAAFHNREAALVHFLQRGHSPDGNTNTDSPLCVAVAAGHTGGVRLLTGAGADVNRSTQERAETPLHLAIKTGRSDIFEELLALGPDLTAQTNTGETVLHYAAGNAGSLAIIVSLLKAGADFELLNTEGCTAAEVAIKSGNINAAVAIISAARGNRRKLAKEKEMLLRHVENAHNRFSLKNELIADLFEASIDPDSTVLVEAIKRNDLSLAKLFLDRGADPNRPTRSGLRPIFAALNCSGAKMIQLLVAQDLDVTIRDPDGLTVLQAILESPSAHDKEAALGIFEALLSKGAEATVTYSDKKTLLHHVVSPELGLSRIVHLLIERGVDVNAGDDSGCTALHLAGHSKACIEALIRHGADASITNHNGLTPLLFALGSTKKDSETDLNFLIMKSDLRAVDSQHKTALHLACERGLEGTVRALLRSRAETTLIDGQARTPLTLAVVNQQWNVVPLLAIQPGVNTWDKEGMTALHYAVRCIPTAPATWKEVASTVRRFCERGASRSMRDRTGATPLIQAVTTLPEDGLPVIEVLLTDTTGGRGNCVDHEDHKQKSALYFAATLGKPSFVKALLKNGASFVFKEWTPAKGPLRPNTMADKQILKLLAEYEWLRRAALLQRQSVETPATPVLPKILPIRDLKELLSMGLDPNVLPFPSKSTYTGLLLWLILNQTLMPPPLPPKYLYDVLKLILTHGADPNATAVRTSNGARISTQSLAQFPLGCHPLAFLLEQYPTVDIDLILLFLDNGSNLTTPSPFYDGRYPLHSAVKANRLDIVDEFLMRRTEVDVRDKNGRSPLFIAAENGLWEITDLLLQKHANIDIQDTEGNKPLHAAAIGGSSKIVSSVLRAGAKALALNQKEAKPITLIPGGLAEKEKSKVIGLLKNAEERERREEERNAERLKREAIEEGKRKRRIEVEQQQRQVEFMATRKPSPPQKPTLANTKTPSSSFLSLALKPRPSPVISSTEVSPRLPKYASPPKQQPEDQQKSTLKVEKPLPQPRIDSGFGFAQKKDENTDKPFPVLDRGKKTFNATEDGEQAKEDDTSELMSWLAVSKALDRL